MGSNSMRPFTDCRRKQARNFEAYLGKHRTRIVNYAYYQAEQLCSIGSGVVDLRSSKLTVAYKFQAQNGTWRP